MYHAGLGYSWLDRSLLTPLLVLLLISCRDLQEAKASTFEHFFASHYLRPPRSRVGPYYQLISTASMEILTSCPSMARSLFHGSSKGACLTHDLSPMRYYQHGHSPAQWPLVVCPHVYRWQSCQMLRVGLL